MTTYTRDEVLKGNHSEFDVALAEKMGEALLQAVQAQYIVWKFHEAPKYLRAICDFNGGDEDWLVLTHSNPNSDWSPNWVEHTDVGREPDEYLLNGVVIFVGSHA